jgi:hypothetical protein
MTSNSACTDIDFIDEFMDVDEENYGQDDPKEVVNYCEQNAYIKYINRNNNSKCF